MILGIAGVGELRLLTLEGLFLGCCSFFIIEIIVMKIL
jgi:hypothetical protein